MVFTRWTLEDAVILEVENSWPESEQQPQVDSTEVAAAQCSFEELVKHIAGNLPDLACSGNPSAKPLSTRLSALLSTSRSSRKVSRRGLHYHTECICTASAGSECPWCIPQQQSQCACLGPEESYVNSGNVDITMQVLQQIDLVMLSIL